MLAIGSIRNGFKNTIMNNIIRIKTISEFTNSLTGKKPRHPLVTYIDFSQEGVETAKEKMKLVSDFYSIFLKGNVCKNLKYGRQFYDFEEGTIVSIAANQVYEVEPNNEKDQPDTGWGLFFHPDLIQGTSLGQQIKKYSFFSYAANEALHLSEKEKKIISEIVEKIDFELDQNIDKHTNQLIVSNLELLLNYLLRFYDRQFITRSIPNQDVLVKLEEYLDRYFSSDSLELKGVPSVKACAEHLLLSPNYLSDLLKKETGKNTQEHIFLKLIEESKNQLLSTQKSVSEIAYSFGYSSPQYFSKVFKKHTQLSPTDFRMAN